MDPPQRGPVSLSTVALVFANAVPLIGVLFLGWQVFPLILLYWLENVIVGGLNVLRMGGADPAGPVRWIAKVFLIPFFCVHFGGFTTIHGVFVFAMFGGPAYAHPFFPTPASVLPAIRQTRLGCSAIRPALSPTV